MPERSPAHTDRRRAESFGAAADAYDRYRPRYPRHSLPALSPARASGCSTSAPEPASPQRNWRKPARTSWRSSRTRGWHVWRPQRDPRRAGHLRGMAAGRKRVRSRRVRPVVPLGRPLPSLEKVAAILRPGGRLALLANRIVPTAPTQQELDEINADYLDSLRGRSSTPRRKWRRCSRSAASRRAAELRRTAALLDRGLPEPGVHLLQSPDARPVGASRVAVAARTANRHAGVNARTTPWRSSVRPRRPAGARVPCAPARALLGYPSIQPFRRGASS